MVQKKKTTPDTRSYSRLVVDGITQAPARAMLRAVGFTEEDFAKPQIGIASTWADLTPCNMHIAELARAAASGADAAGGKSVLFNTITVSDGISMGSPGMRYSLVSREVIADSIETVVGAEGFDGLVALGGSVATSSRYSRRWAAQRPAPSAPRNYWKSNVPLSLAPEVAAACIPPTPWPRRSRRWA
jgi:hypothetical protein